MDAISDFFGNLGDDISDFFGNITDWADDNLASGPWPAFLGVAISIALLFIIN
jgi:hypothetical protein